MNDTIDTAVALNVLHLRAAAQSLVRRMGYLVKTIGISFKLLDGGLGLEQSNAEASRLEDINNLLDDIGCGLAILRMWHIGLERCV